MVVVFHKFSTSKQLDAKKLLPTDFDYKNNTKYIHQIPIDDIIYRVKPIVLVFDYIIFLYFTE